MRPIVPARSGSSPGSSSPRSQRSRQSQVVPFLLRTAPLPSVPRVAVFGPGQGPDSDSPGPSRPGAAPGSIDPNDDPRPGQGRDTVLDDSHYPDPASNLLPGRQVLQTRFHAKKRKARRGATPKEPLCVMAYFAALREINSQPFHFRHRSVAQTVIGASHRSPAGKPKTMKMHACIFEGDSTQNPLCADTYNRIACVPPISDSDSLRSNLTMVKSAMSVPLGDDYRKLNL